MESRRALHVLNAMLTAITLQTLLALRALNSLGPGFPRQAWDALVTLWTLKALHAGIALHA